MAKLLTAVRVRDRVRLFRGQYGKIIDIHQNHEFPADEIQGYPSSEILLRRKGNRVKIHDILSRNSLDKRTSHHTIVLQPRHT